MNEQEKKLTKVSQYIREGINQWADIMLQAEADQWAYHLDYFPRDIINAVIIYQHICSNIGFKAGRIDEQKAAVFGQRLRQLTIDMTGYDPAQIVSKPKDES